MVQITSILFALVLSCPISHVLAAPVNITISSDTFLQNGQAAQQLNAEFQNLTINDQCQSGQQACIAGAQATCNTGGAWEAVECPTNTECFALPNKKSNGTNLKCTSEQDALSLIQDTGAQGGIFGDNSNGTDSGSNGATATVTIIVSPSTTQTIDPQTTTLDSVGVNSLLSSLQSGGVAGTSTSSDAVTTATDAPTTTAAAGALATGSADPAAPSIILLTTGASSPTTTSDTSSQTPNAALGSASASPSAPPSNDGYKR